MLDGAEALQPRAQQALELALELGASDAFVSATREQDVGMDMRDGNLEKVEQSTSRSLSVQLWVDGRYGGHSTSDLRPDALRRFLTDAIALTRALEPDNDRQIPDPALYEGRSTADLELHDPQVVALNREARTALLTEMDGIVRGTDKLISATSGVYDGHSVTVTMSSNGFEGTRQGTYASVGTYLTLQGEGDARPEDGLYASMRHLSDLPPARQIAEQAQTWALARLGAQKGATAKTTMLVHPRAAGRLIARLLQPATGQAMQQGRSMWRDKQGQALLSPGLTILDDPLVTRAFGSRHFDSEGIAAVARPMIEGGALQNLYLDTTYARKLSMAPTTGSPSNRRVALGDRSLDDLIGATSSGYLVTSWLGGNMDGTTGDFSFGVRGVQIDKGRRAGSVGEMNVTGNILELFRRLAEVGNDPWPYSSTHCGTLVFGDVSFSGV